MSESLHQYGQVVLGVILTAILTVTVALFNRLDKLEEKVLHRDYLSEKFNHMEYRIEKLEKKQ